MALPQGKQKTAGALREALVAVGRLPALSPPVPRAVLLLAQDPQPCVCLWTPVNPYLSSLNNWTPALITLLSTCMNSKRLLKDSKLLLCMTVDQEGMKFLAASRNHHLISLHDIWQAMRDRHTNSLQESAARLADSAEAAHSASRRCCSSCLNCKRSSCTL